MELFKKVCSVKVPRWSYTVAVLCYVIFVVMIWVLRIPLVPEPKPHMEADSFEIRLRNSNFNSDQTTVTNVEHRNEYLISVQDGEKIRKSETQILTEVFTLADTDGSKKLDIRELATWIRNKIIQHINEAIGNNKLVFHIIDQSPRDGVISWEEYHLHFMIEHGFSKEFANNHDEKRHRGVPRKIREAISRYKSMWSETPKVNPAVLSIEEFLAFTHPESFLPNHLALVDELYDKFDKDGDELLTEDEFAILQTEGIGEEPVVIRQNEQQRREEFRHSIDSNKDGKADRRELLHYVAPQSLRNSEHEAEALLSVADADHDNMLSMDEMLSHPHLFLRSKMIDTARSFHDEF